MRRVAPSGLFVSTASEALRPSVAMTSGIPSYGRVCVNSLAS